MIKTFVTLPHACLALVVAIVMPVCASLTSVRLAWSMYASSASYRLVVTAFDARGAATALAPTQLAHQAGGEVAVFLAGSDHWRHAPIANVLRPRLGELAALACRRRPGAMVEVTLEERSTVAGAVRTTSARSACAR